ncbi:class I SAM-dependent methyltransferase [Aliiglaciecola sp. CAU 1673]|uniref:class I SAM-dependent methyltransferase n=1 Tax=Aliiglaciecola sp. CAU 1673 TaxID=3032595 RepID=UPI0023DB5A05|nr:class I SAM-dependent methyltransferase [Aliiglaciecola sp. CAU 1673]MDF2178308.1 class I SAM-dependent methyltransferase [Aliiglaciecola sp. CAU 1673]
MKLSELKDKFSRGDNEYLQRRKQFAEEIGEPRLYERIDHFALYAGEQTLGNKLAVYEMLKETLSVPGHIAEFGTWKGANLMFMAKTLQLLSPNSTKMVLGFDNFSGLPSGDRKDGEHIKSLQGAYCGDEALLRKAISMFQYDDYVHLIVGDANQTIPQFANDNPEVLISLAYIDFDIYEPVKTALTFLEDRLAVGGIIAFDEAISAIWPGETVAMLEFLQASGSRYQMVANSISRQPVMYLRKLA